MSKYAIAILKKLANIIELFIAFMLAIAIILLSLRLAGSLINIPNFDVYPNYEDLLETCFNLIIGVEPDPHGLHASAGNCIRSTALRYCRTDYCGSQAPQSTV